MKVLVTGASGFVGNHIIRQLVREGHNVIGLSRKAPSGGRRIDGVEYIAGVDVTDKSTLPPDAFAAANAVVHLVGIIMERKPKQTFVGIHVNGTRNIVEAAKTGGVTKFIYMSAIGSKPDAAAEYSRTKAAAEEIVRTSGIDYVILRPSIILGRDGEFVQQMKELVKYGGLPVKIPFPFVPVPGSGKNKFQPISVQELSKCVERCVSDNEISNRTIEIAGGEQVTFNQIIAYFTMSEGVKKPIIHAPIPILKLVAPLVELTPKPPFSSDQLKNLGLDNITDITEMKSTFCIEPTGFYKIMQAIYGSSGTH